MSGFFKSSFSIIFLYFFRVIVLSSFELYMWSRNFSFFFRYSCICFFFIAGFMGWIGYDGQEVFDIDFLGQVIGFFVSVFVVKEDTVDLGLDLNNFYVGDFVEVFLRNGGLGFIQLLIFYWSCLIWLEEQLVLIISFYIFLECKRVVFIVFLVGVMGNMFILGFWVVLILQQFFRFWV